MFQGNGQSSATQQGRWQNDRDGDQGWQSQGQGMPGYRTGQSAETSHQGKGPKGYQRSDDRIKESVNDALEDDHNVDASEIEVQVQGGEVTLTGTVNDRMQKRRAEDVASGLRGVRDVHNGLRVSPQGQSQGHQAQGGQPQNAQSQNVQGQSQNQGGQSQRQTGTPPGISASSTTTAKPNDDIARR